MDSRMGKSWGVSKLAPLTGVVDAIRALLQTSWALLGKSAKTCAFLIFLDNADINITFTVVASPIAIILDMGNVIPF